LSANKGEFHFCARANPANGRFFRKGAAIGIRELIPLTCIR
jgi:hypothetical protein